MTKEELFIISDIVRRDDLVIEYKEWRAPKSSHLGFVDVTINVAYVGTLEVELSVFKWKKGGQGVVATKDNYYWITRTAKDADGKDVSIQICRLDKSFRGRINNWLKQYYGGTVDAPVNADEAPKAESAPVAGAQTKTDPTELKF